MGRASRALGIALACAGGCSDTSTDADATTTGVGADAATASAQAGAAGTTAGTDTADAAGEDASSAPAAEDPCSPDALREPSAALTYYVAIEEPGADNASCDGLSPRDEGGGRCPFKDFTAERTLRLLDGVAGTRVEIRRGLYTVQGWEGLRVNGTGRSAQERVILSAHPGEQPVLDVPRPDGEGCTAATAPDDPLCVRQVITVSGQHTVVQGLTIQNGLGYHLEVRGGSQHLVRCNRIGETVAFAMRSDLVKLDGGATGVQVLHNDLSAFRSQAIDMTQVFDVLVEGNDFHDPIDADAGATGVKLGARNVTIRGNRVHDLGASTQLHAFALGGTGTEHADAHTAYGVHVIDNTVWNVAGTLAQLTSCEGCSLEDNTLWSAGGGIVLSQSGTGLAECATAPAGCGPNQGTRIAGNRMRDLNGGGDAAQANVFVLVEPGEHLGLVAEDNVYCAPSAAAARFGFEGDLLDFDAWVAAVHTDDGSRPLPASDPDCAF